MPAKSQSQRGLIFAKRDQYKSKAKTPDKWKWIWDEGWENKGKLPKKKKKNETVQNMVFNENSMRARTVNESIYGKDYASDDTRPRQKEEDEGWSLKSGDEVIFRLRGMGPEFEDADEGDIIKYDGQLAIIDSPETASEIGDRDYEYYNIWFPGKGPGEGEMFYGVSGYHLDDV